MIYSDSGSTRNKIPRAISSGRASRPAGKVAMASGKPLLARGRLWSVDANGVIISRRAADFKQPISRAPHDKPHAGGDGFSLMFFA